MDTRKLTGILKERKQELFDLLSELIKIDSQNFGSSGREANIAEYIARYLTDMGYSPDVYSPDSVPGILDNPDYWPGHNLGNRPNVSCVIPGTSHDRRVMIAAHSDTVPVGDPANWTSDPFSGDQRDGKIWGRGACDDKYGIATALFLIRVFRDEGIALPYDLVFTAYCDEERGGGNGTLAACLKYPCDDIINLDCKSFEIWTNAVGGGEFKIHIRARNTVDSCLSVLPGLNVLAEELAAFKERRRAELAAYPAYADTIIPDTSVRFMDIHAGNNTNDLDRGSCYVTYYTAKNREEMNIEWEEMRKSIEGKLEPLGLCFDRYEMTTRFFHFQATDRDNSFMRTLIDAGAEVSGRTLTPCGSCLSDLSLFIKYGSKKAFAFGIGRDFDVSGGAHQANEYIETDPFIEFTEIIGAALINA